MIRKTGLILGGIIILVALAITIQPSLLFALSAWKTQEILFRNQLNKDHRIELQMQDQGALGYNRRIVEVNPMLFIDKITEIDTTGINMQEWQQVDEYVNELELKGG